MRDSETLADKIHAIWLRLKHAGASLLAYKPSFFVAVVISFIGGGLMGLYAYHSLGLQLESPDVDVRKNAYIQLLYFSSLPFLTLLMTRLLDLIPNPFERFAKSRKTAASRKQSQQTDDPSKDD